MRRRHALLLVALLAALPVQGCGSGGIGPDTECSAEPRFSGTTFRPVGTWQVPVRGKRLGRAGYVGCDGRLAPRLGTVAVFAVGKVDPTQAIMTAGRHGDLVFVPMGFPPSRWPPLVRAAARFLRCTEPMTFRGRWNYIETDTVPGPELYDIPVPYRALFTARSSDAIDPDTWVSNTLRARVTEDTDPVPSVETATTAIRDHRPVTVSTTCTDNGTFEVTHLELSGPPPHPAGVHGATTPTAQP